MKIYNMTYQDYKEISSVKEERYVLARVYQYIRQSDPQGARDIFKYRKAKANNMLGNPIVEDRLSKMVEFFNGE